MGKTPERMSTEELAKFIRAYCDGRIFTSAFLEQGESDLLPMIFMPIAFGAFEGWTREEVEQVGVIWEYLDQAGPRSINGQPCFFSMRIMSLEDWKKAAEIIRKEMERREASIASDLGEVEVDPVVEKESRDS